MIEGDPLVPGAAALGQAKDYLRVHGSQEDALIGRALASAAELCEQFTGEILLAREFRETLRASGAWTRLARRPVRAISGVERLADGVATALPPSGYALDVDAAGAGWVRAVSTGAGQLKVHYTCGLAASWDELAEPLAQGIVRLAAHLYTHRSGADDPGPPAAVTALWRPYRRMRIG